MIGYPEPNIRYMSRVLENITTEKNSHNVLVFLGGKGLVMESQYIRK